MDRVYTKTNLNHNCFFLIMTTYKQVILVRQDLKLPKGKLAAQAAHASVDAVLKSDKDLVKAWREEGMAKIVLKVKDEKELIKYFQFAKDSGIKASLITDAGRTVIAPGTRTCVGIGPGDDEEIDKITGELSLL
jgi:peptidyl-tRNA hydrolase, PTH2 family